MSVRSTIETLQDLESLIGLYEHIRLEMKSSKIFYDWKEKTPEREKYVNTLSKEISGMANTEGGQILLGMITEKVEREPDKAVSLDDGIAFKDFSPETIQRSIEASISPPITGTRFIPIKTKLDEKRYYLLIDVPKGSTAHQAKDKIYYGRSEFETVPLHDSVIRLLMNKVVEPHAIIQFERVADIPPSYGTNPIHILLFNDGELNIYCFKLRLLLRNAGKICLEAMRWWHEDNGEGQGETVQKKDLSYHFRDSRPAPPYSLITDAGFQAVIGYDVKSIPVNIFPRDTFDIGYIGLSRYSHIPKDAEIGWTIFLMNSRPVEGKVSIASILKSPKVEIVWDDTKI